MKKTKHFNISVPELGDVPDITQVSNAISDLEDATAGTLEIMKAEMQGTKITLTSVSRKTKRTGYYEGMSIRFKSPQDIEPNYLKTISIDELGDQTLSVEYKVNRNEYIDIIYEGSKFSAYPVVVQKTDSVSNNSSILVGTAKGVKTAYDKGAEALNKANQAQSSANNAQSTADGKVSKSGDTITGQLIIDRDNDNIVLKAEGEDKGSICASSTGWLGIVNKETGNFCALYDDGKTSIKANNLNTQEKEVIEAINELNSKKLDKGGYSGTANDLKIEIEGKEPAFVKKSGFNKDKTDSYEEDDTNKIGTARALKRLYDWIKNKLADLTLSWDKITNKPNLTTTEDLTQLLKGKVSKSGDTMTDTLTIDTTNYKPIQLNYAGVEKGSVGVASMWVGIHNVSTNKFIALYDNGTAALQSGNLRGGKGELIESYNDLYDSALLGITGNNSVKFVQDVITKEQNNIYTDKTTKKLYLCTKTNNDTSITENFIEITNLSLANRQEIGSNTNGNYQIDKITGYKIQWGRTKLMSTDEHELIAFPKQFKNQNSIIITATQVSPTGSVDPVDNQAQITSHTTNGFYIHSNNAGGVQGNCYYNWIAIGI